MELERIDKFYLILVAVLILMSTLFIFTIKGAVSLFLTAYEFDSQLVPQSVRVNREKLDEAFNFAFNRGVVKLEVR